jgi:hypothetical protein
MCVRITGDLQNGDTLLEPTTFDEVGELLTVAAVVYTDTRGRYWLDVNRTVEVRHPEESSPDLARGLYRIKSDTNWPGAALKGVCYE